jgi:hypothetical protein
MLSDDLLLKIAAHADLPTAFALYSTCRRLYAHWLERERPRHFDNWQRKAAQRAIRWCRQYHSANDVPIPEELTFRVAPQVIVQGVKTFIKSSASGPIIVIGNKRTTSDFEFKESSLVVLINVQVDYILCSRCIIGYDSSFRSISCAQIELYRSTLISPSLTFISAELNSCTTIGVIDCYTSLCYHGHTLCLKNCDIHNWRINASSKYITNVLIESCNYNYLFVNGYAFFRSNKRAIIDNCIIKEE